MLILGERIKALRDKKDIQQKELAKKLGLTQTTLSRYETGERNPDPEVIVKIADFFEVTTDYLLGRNHTLSKQQQEMMNDIDLENEEFIRKYSLKVDGEDINEEEIEMIIGYIRATRDIRKKKGK